MKRDHVLSTWSRRTTHWTLNRILISRFLVLTSFRKSYHFQLTTIVLRACSLLVDWDPYHPRSKDEPTLTFWLTFWLIFWLSFEMSFEMKKKSRRWSTTRCLQKIWQWAWFSSWKILLRLQVNQYCYAFCEKIEASFCDELKFKIAKNEHSERFVKEDYTYMQ